MNYTNSVLIDALAQRYVIGTMSYRARRRFTQILEQNPKARAVVLKWEEQMTPLLLSLDPVTPSELVWQRILREMNSFSSSKSIKKRDAGRGLAYGVAASIFFISFSITSLGWWQSANQPVETIIETRIVNVPEPAIVSVLADQNATRWIARIYQDSARIDLDVQAEPAEQLNKDYELWALQDDGKPVSLGLLPQKGQKSLQLNSKALASLARSKTLAVSLEPLGGSPQPVPTGPVLFTARLLPPASSGDKPISL